MAKPVATDLREDLACPGCGQVMAAQLLRPSGAASAYRSSEVRVQGCARCRQVWIGHAQLAELVAAAARDVDERAPLARRTLTMPERVVYRRCPACDATMDRRNFGRYSGVVVDQCVDCGTSLGPDDLDAILAFVRSGGLAHSAAREQLERSALARRRRLDAGVRAPVLAAPRPLGERSIGEVIASCWRWLRGALDGARGAQDKTNK